MNNFHHFIINKNRGWRGLAEIIIRDEEYKEQLKMIFSFSQAVWDDLLKGYIVVADDKYYYVIHFDNTVDRLPTPAQQRSILIKDCVAKILEVNRYEKTAWSSATGSDWVYIMHHRKNRNNHTTSDWNCIGIRVVPTI